MKFSSKILKCQLSPVRKFNPCADQAVAAGRTIYHLNIGQPDVKTPEAFYEAIRDFKAETLEYAPAPGLSAHIEAVQAYYAKLGVKLDKGDILATSGGGEALEFILACILDEGDEILVPDPAWLNYHNVPRMLGAVPVTYSLKEENGYQMDLAELRSKVTDKTKAVVIITPNNPTGGVLSQDTLQGLADLAIEKDLLVISDEVYERLIYDGEKHISIASLPGMKERTFTMNGMSKAYSMTGWRLGYVAAPEAYIAVLNKFHQHNTTCAPSFVQTASVAALRDEKNEVNDMVKEYQRRRDYAVKAINDIPGLSCLCPKGAFYIFINCKSLGKPSAELASYLLDEAKIALVPGDVFGPGGEGYLRLSFANSYDNIVEGCKRLAQAVAKLRQ